MKDMCLYLADDCLSFRHTKKQNNVVPVTARKE